MICIYKQVLVSILSCFFLFDIEIKKIIKINIKRLNFNIKKLLIHKKWNLELIKFNHKTGINAQKICMKLIFINKMNIQEQDEHTF